MTAGGRFAWSGLALGLTAAIVLGGSTAFAATVAQSYFCPWLIFPLVVGIALGALLVGAVRVSQIGHRGTIFAAAILAAVLASAGQHYFAYLAVYGGGRWDMRLRQPVEEKAAELLRGPQPSFAEFLRQEADRGRPMVFGYVARGRLAWLSWAIDGAVVIAAALMMVWPAARQPYCCRCRTWYRTVRAGRVDAARAAAVAQAAGIAMDAPPRSARFRLQNCLGGCGPTRLVLSSETADGEQSLSRIWLDAADRDRITHALESQAGD